MSTKTEYRQIVKAEVPERLRWTTPRRNQGQTVETSYAQPGARDDAGYGDLYMRTVDHSDGRAWYYKRA